MQATSFVTDNYNLDMQWLNTIDQPLVDEAVFWSERAATEDPNPGNTQPTTLAQVTAGLEAGLNPEGAVLNNTQANLALQVAAEAPSSRQDLSVTINNAVTGNPTQITVFATGDGSSIHDVAPSVFSSVESVVFIVVDIAAVVTGQ